MAEIIPLTVEHLRDIREAIDRLHSQVEQSFETLTLKIAELRDEMRQTRTALTGVGYLVNLSIGDFKAEIARMGERIERLERERA
jgi:hypothetical protein